MNKIGFGYFHYLRMTVSHFTLDHGFYFIVILGSNLGNSKRFVLVTETDSNSVSQFARVKCIFICISL